MFTSNSSSKLKQLNFVGKPLDKTSETFKKAPALTKSHSINKSIDLSASNLQMRTTNSTDAMPVPQRPVSPSNSRLRIINTSNNEGRDSLSRVEHIEAPTRKSAKFFSSGKKPVIASAAFGQQHSDAKASSLNAELADIKRLQRNQIYALNELMSRLEYEKFVEFCKENNLAFSASSSP